MSYEMIYCGDCLKVMPEMDAASVDAIVTDPPYGLSFMGRDWDHGVPGEAFWREALRVAKPGTHLLAFGGTRTYHRLACAIEDAGWEVRDCIMWVYGSGFPKSLDVSKAIDKAAGVAGGHGPMKRGGERLARLENGYRCGNGTWGDESGRDPYTYAPATDLARKWSGWGTALKPAYEPIIVARKPLDGTVAENVTAYGTGAINVDGCRVGTEQTTTVRNGNSGAHGRYGVDTRVFVRENPPGRWPANLIHDGSEEVVGGFPEPKWIPGDDDEPGYWHAPASRFFYCAKASKADRDEGCEGLAAKVNPRLCDTGYESPTHMDGKPCSVQRNNHPTVKPTALMRYLCRLVTPPGGVVLDPFAGSGSTGKAAVLEGFSFIGLELNAEYVEISRARIENAKKKSMQ